MNDTKETPLPVSTTPELEMQYLAESIRHAQDEIDRVQEQLSILRDKQNRRRIELMEQWTRLHAPENSPRVFDTPQPGARMVVVQTEAGLAARWVLPLNHANGTGESAA